MREYRLVQKESLKQTTFTSEYRDGDDDWRAISGSYTDVGVCFKELEHHSDLYVDKFIIEKSYIPYSPEVYSNRRYRVVRVQFKNNETIFYNEYRDENNLEHLWLRISPTNHSNEKFCRKELNKHFNEYIESYNTGITYMPYSYPYAVNCLDIY